MKFGAAKVSTGIISIYLASRLVIVIDYKK